MFLARATVQRIFGVMVVLLVSLQSGCEHFVVEPPTSAIPPKVESVRINDNANNVLSAVVSARTRNAVAVAVEFDADSLFSQCTAFIQPSGDSARIPLLGLEPGQRYVARVVAASANRQKAYGPALAYQTRSLPNDIPSLSVLTNASPASGLVILAFSSPANAAPYYAIAVDNVGRIVWYRAFPSPVVDFQKQPRGTYTVFTSTDGSPPHFYEMDNLGNILREFAAGNGIDTGPHEIRLRDEGYVLFGIEFKQMDLTAIGGLPNASVRSSIVEFNRAGAPPFRWDPREHLQVSDTAADNPVAAAAVNPWHGNAIDIDTDGHLLVSFRNCDEIIKINSQSGAIIWRLGGKNNHFSFINDRFNGFSHQHGVRRLANGNLILFDNGNLHTPQASRAVEYSLHEAAKTAEVVWEYNHEPPLYSFALGFAQRLANGHTLICYGTAQRIVEVDQAGTKRWELAVNAPGAFVYRAFRIDRLN